MLRFRLIPATLLGALVLVAAGCGGGDDDGEPPAEGGELASPYERDACELLDSGDLEELTGEVPEALPAEGDAETLRPSQCTWSGAQPISLLLGDEGLFEGARMSAEGAEGFERLHDLGDAAFVGGAEGGVLVGGVGITISALGITADPEGTRELIAELLARAADNY